ncbi:6722_t:CDS:2 [Racocetra persica]|uniref:6722_t:CDS:1 n=1 Tax=Racocetra persica TaxID=160502 RepID=A0ACA9KRC5_9GLOM|nr:6722_t:CDS:2 [Racocetra persica]
MTQLPKVYSKLNSDQEKEIDEIIKKMQDGLFVNESEISELGWIVKYLYEEFLLKVVIITFTPIM